MESSRKRKVKENKHGAKVVRVTRPDGSKIVKRTRPSGATSTRRIGADGNVKRITKTTKGETKELGRRSKEVKAAKQIAAARQAEKTRGVKAKGTAGRIARLQAKRKAANQSGNTKRRDRIQAKISQAKTNLREKIDKRTKKRDLAKQRNSSS
jgi:hypothetical protein|tara:strand:+ start:1852 stop:2310 length:459 start_codon:yes stop_codon:yes gene_type:complete